MNSLNINLKRHSQKLIVLCLITSSALAGNVTRWGGHVNVLQSGDGSGNASGVLSITYNNILAGVYGGQQPYIGCQSYSDDSLFCHAVDVDENYASCSSDSEYLSRSVKMIAPDSRISFEWNQSGQCTAISVVHSSRFEDKQR